MMAHLVEIVVRPVPLWAISLGLGWQTKRFNLTDYRGEDIRLKFTFCSDGSEHDFEGWYVDDIKIIKAADESVVTYSEGFERIGYGWIAQNEAGELIGKLKVHKYIQG